MTELHRIAVHLRRFRDWAAHTFLRPASIVLHDSRADLPREI